MKDYVICIDASVDIDQKYIEDNNIVIIPMKYILGETEHLMENRLSDAQLLDFYNAMRAGEMTGPRYSLHLPVRGTQQHLLLRPHCRGRDRGRFSGARDRDRRFIGCYRRNGPSPDERCQGQTGRRIPFRKREGAPRKCAQDLSLVPRR